MKLDPIRLTWVTTRAAVSFSFSFVFTRDLYNTHYITYFMAHSFYAFLVPHIVVGVLLTCQSLDPEYKTTALFQMYFQEKKVLYSGQYGITKFHACTNICIANIFMNANLFCALQNHFKSGKIIWCNANLFGVLQKYYLRFHILFNAFRPQADGNGPGRGTSVALVRSIAASLAAETDTRTITESAVVRGTVIVRETVTVRETENVSGSIAVSWRGRCVSCLSLCLCFAPLFLQDSDVHASYPAEVGITGTWSEKVSPWTYNVMTSTVIYFPYS